MLRATLPQKPPRIQPNVATDNKGQGIVLNRLNLQVCSLLNWTGCISLKIFLCKELALTSREIQSIYLSECFPDFVAPRVHTGEDNQSD